MSLNRYERMLCDYVESRTEERRYWESRVGECARDFRRREEAALRLNAMLWDYFEERARHESPFRDVFSFEGGEKVSLLNLSEYWLRLWAPPPKKAPARG